MAGSYHRFIDRKSQIGGNHGFEPSWRFPRASGDRPPSGAPDLPRTEVPPRERG